VAIAFVAQAKANGNGTYSTSDIDTTGATLLVVCYSDDGSPTPTLSDSKGNTWTQARRYAPFGPAITIEYAWNPTVGTGHTITLTGAGQAGSAQFWAFSGVDTGADPLDQSNNNHAFGSTTVTPGSVTPGSDGQLVVAADNYDAMASVPTVNGGFTTPAYGDVGSGGTYMGSASSYLIQTTAAAANPTFTTPSTNNQYAAIATFGPAPPPAAVSVSSTVRYT
jgi:hypothetical protein